MAVVNISNATKASFLSALNSALGASATMTFYTGSMPVGGPDASVPGGDTTICTITFQPSGSFGTVSGNVLSATGLPFQAQASATGTVSWARLQNSSNTAIIDVDVGTSGTTCIVANTSVTSGNFLQITSCTFTQP
jgi:hypothetical protein